MKILVKNLQKGIKMNVKVKTNKDIHKKNPKNNLDVEMGALLLIDALYQKGVLNTETYNNIQKKYKIN